MTNAQICLQECLDHYSKLSDYEREFIDKIKSWDKKQLRKLSYKQYCWLRDIAHRVIKGE